MWTRLWVAHQQRLVSPALMAKRFQSAQQYYPINDDMFGFTADQKQVRRSVSGGVRFFYLRSLAPANGLRLRPERISPSRQ